MATGSRCRRRNRRYSIPGDMEASVSFAYPGPEGRAFTLEIRDVSVGGVSFALSGESPRLEVGETVREVDLSLNGERIRGEIVVMHVTPNVQAGWVCGAFFYPEDDSELRHLADVVAKLGRMDE